MLLKRGREGKTKSKRQLRQGEKKKMKGGGEEQKEMKKVEKKQEAGR